MAAPVGPISIPGSVSASSGAQQGGDIVGGGGISITGIRRGGDWTTVAAVGALALAAVLVLR